jgi:hypothetical protein
MDRIWAAGDYSGVNRPMARVTVQRQTMKLYSLPYNLYASLIFGDPATVPKELPNVKSVKWSRGVDNDIATGTIEFYNTAPQDLGTVFHPQYGLDQPGYYTFTRGKSSFSSRWGDKPNEWSNLLVADNILRTYEGYGFDVTTSPEKDLHLVQTGVWMIKEVTLTAIGLISVAIEDMGSILRDQICFHPVIPKNFYPLTFSAEPKKSGFADGYTYTKTVDSGGNYDPAHPPPGGWNGPLTAPGGVSVTSGSQTVTVAWSPVPAPSGNFSLVGYQLVIDNVRLPTKYGPSATSATVQGAPWSNGNVYLTQVVAIYKRTSDGHEQVGDQSTPAFAYPQNPTLAAVSNVLGNTGPPPADPLAPTVPQPGFLAIDHTTSSGTISVIVFNAGAQKVFSVAVTSGSRVYLNTGLGDLVPYNVLAYPVDPGGSVGKGFLLNHTGQYFAPPVDGAAPHQPNPPAPVATVTRNRVTVPLKLTKEAITLSDTSNTYYVGAGPETGIYGHTPSDALDTDLASYWLSIGNADPGRGSAYEWFEVKTNGSELAKVKWKTAKGHYYVYVSVFAKGTWTHHAASDVIPYNEALPESHNHANIPFIGTAAMGGGEDGEHTFKSPIPGATKLRLTFHNLQDFGLGAEHYRAGLKNIEVFNSSGGTTATVNTRTTPQPTPGPPQDDNAPAIVSSYEVYVPPKETPGAGEQPGFYEDYTDIIKLLLAWGGFYWPENATLTESDGTVDTYSWGPGLFGLKNVDPVMGDQDSGRVWGDFQNTGTAGLASFPVSVWDKKSLLDGINLIRDTIGFIFYIDETGGAVWRLPNYFSLGNYVGTLAAEPGRTSNVVIIDETQTLMALTAKLSSHNVREAYFVSSTDGQTGGLSKGYNPNPIGLRRVGGWTDAHFGTTAEAQLMADMIAVRALMSYHQDTLQIPGYPRIQPDDQVKIYERVTGEGYQHYVNSVSSNNDLETGIWTYDLNTSWLGENPDLTGAWAFDLKLVSEELANYLASTVILSPEPPIMSAEDPGATNLYPQPGAQSNPATDIGQQSQDVPKVAKLVQIPGDPAIYITDGITRRHVVDQVDKNFLVKSGLVPTGTSTPITAAELNHIVLVGGA